MLQQSLPSLQKKPVRLLSRQVVGRAGACPSTQKPWPTACSQCGMVESSGAISQCVQRHAIRAGSSVLHFSMQSSTFTIWVLQFELIQPQYSWQVVRIGDPPHSSPQAPKHCGTGPVMSSSGSSKHPPRLGLQSCPKHALYWAIDRRHLSLSWQPCNCVPQFVAMQEEQAALLSAWHVSSLG